MTPQALYEELARNAQFILSTWSGDATRRQARMKAPLEHDKAEEASEGENEDNEADDEVPMRPKDDALDIDAEFRCCRNQFRSAQRFANWQEVAKIAFEVHLDEMRTLLEPAT